MPLLQTRDSAHAADTDARDLPGIGIFAVRLNRLRGIGPDGHYRCLGGRARRDVSKSPRRTAAGRARSAAPAAPESSSPQSSGRSSPPDTSNTDDGVNALMNSGLGVGLLIGGAVAAGCAAVSPYALPRLALHDEGSSRSRLSAVPGIHDEPGYLQMVPIPWETKPFAVRLDVEYMESFDGLDNLVLDLLVETCCASTSARSWNRFEEPDGVGGDSLNLGNCNLLYRFAQGELGRSASAWA